MDDPVTGILADVIDCLRAINHDALQPAAAQDRFAGLCERHPHLALEIVWQEEPYDGSLHYDALIRAADGAETVSISVCPVRALPWPLRGVQHLRDSDLLRVNRTVLEVADAIAQMETLLDSAPLMQRLIDSCLITEALEQYQPQVSAPELEVALESIRRQRGLLSATDTVAWMQSTGITPQMLDSMTRKHAQTLKLREILVGTRIDAHFAHQREDFDRVHLAQIRFRSEQRAADCAHQVRSGAIEFLDMAQQTFLADPTHAERSLFHATWRCRLPASLRSAIEHAAAGDVAGPVADDEGHWIVQLLSVQPAELDAETRRVVSAVLFEQWLAERRRTAHIEWYWRKTNHAMPTGAGAPSNPEDSAL